MIIAAFGILNTCILQRQWLRTAKQAVFAGLVKGQAGSSKVPFHVRTKDRGNHGIRAANSI
jgi:hypothetical protein